MAAANVIPDEQVLCVPTRALYSESRPVAWPDGTHFRDMAGHRQEFLV